MDYSKLLDDEVLAFIAKTNGLLPDDDTEDMGLIRARYDRMAATVAAPIPDGIEMEEAYLGGVRCVIFTPPTPRAATLIYFHGGGYVLGSPETHADITAEIAAALSLRVISVDYRLAPEHIHPTHFDDGLSVLTATATRYDGKIVLSGDSAGGCLAACLCHQTRGTGPEVAGQVLIYPMLGGPTDAGTHVTHADAPMLSTRALIGFDTLRAGGALPTDDPSFYPLQDTDFSALPPTFISTAECDPLSGDGEIYANKITDAGGQAVLIPEQGLVHAHLRARSTSKRARAAFDRIIGAIDLLADGIWPY